MSRVEYFTSNHIIVIKTHGRRCIRQTLRTLGFGKYTPTGFSALIAKFKYPNATAIIFSTGNITIMGPKTYWGAMYILDYLREKLDIHIASIKLTNVVVRMKAAAIIPPPIDLDDIFMWRRGNSVCDKELFPSCTYSVPGTNIKANIFATSNVVIAGCRDNESIYKTIKIVLSYLARYNKRREENKTKHLTLDDVDAK